MTGKLPRCLGMSLPGALLSLLVGAVAGVGGYTFQYAEGGSYFSNDPAACVNCHVMREHYDGWQKANHHAVAVCNDCHIPHDLVGKYVVKAENGFWHSKGFTLQDFHEPIRIKPRNSLVLQGNCIDCHAEMVSEILCATRRPGEVSCVHCHGAVGHGSPR